MNIRARTGILALAFAGLLLPAFAAAEIYKCTNAGGEVEYRNTPCEKNVPQEVLPENQPQIVTWGKDGSLRLKEEGAASAPKATPDSSASAVDNAPEAAMSLVNSIRAYVRDLMNNLHITGLAVVFALYLVMSVVSFLTHRRDKRESMRKSGRPRRVPENTLHLQEIFGGWPGALLAQRIYRHKTLKLDYQYEFWLIVGIHLLLWGDYLFGWPMLRALFDLLR